MIGSGSGLCARIPANRGSSPARKGAVISRHERVPSMALDILRLENRLIGCPDSVFPTRRSASRLRSGPGRALHERGVPNPIALHRFMTQPVCISVRPALQERLRRYRIPRSGRYSSGLPAPALGQRPMGRSAGMPTVHFPVSVIRHRACGLRWNAADGRCFRYVHCLLAGYRIPGLGTANDTPAAAIRSPEGRIDAPDRMLSAILASSLQTLPLAS